MAALQRGWKTQGEAAGWEYTFWNDTAARQYLGEYFSDEVVAVRTTVGVLSLLGVGLDLEVWGGAQSPRLCASLPPVSLIFLFPSTCSPALSSLFPPPASLLLFACPRVTPCTPRTGL